MRPRPRTIRAATMIATVSLLIGLAAPIGLGGEVPNGGGGAGNRLARLFRLGGGAPASSAGAAGHNHDHTPNRGTPPSPIRPRVLDESASLGYPTPGLPAASTPPSTPALSDHGPVPRITPQPRVSRPPTEADPLVSRVAIGRSDNGGQFGMFLQVFADGTVLDSEGVHRVGADAMKPIQEALQGGDLYRLKGHCGAPSTDFIEQAHVVVYERSYGKLRAVAFSYSGNPQGCDPSVRRLHAALDALQARLGSASATTSVATAPASPAPAPSGGGTPVLGLTPPSP